MLYEIYILYTIYYNTVLTYMLPCHYTQVIANEYIDQDDLSNFIQHLFTSMLDACSASSELTRWLNGQCYSKPDTTVVKWTLL